MKTILTILLFLFSIGSWARWPMFIIPTKEQLQTSMIFDTTSCAPGFGRVHKGTALAANKFSAAFCPSAWQWQIMNDSECFELKALSYFNNSIQQVYANGLVQKSIVTAYYGIENMPIFSLVFSSPEEHWDCYEVNKNQKVISCANDI